MTSMTLSPLAAWHRSSDATPELAAMLESHGYGALWLGGSPSDLLSLLPLFEASDTLVIATGIVNIWASPAPEIAAQTLELLTRYPDRFLLGIGVGHPEKHADAARPLEGMTRYLDVLDAAGVPADRLVLAALGDKMLRIAAERSAGAHPYLTPPAHTRHAREVLGPTPLLVPEQRVVLRTDADEARAIGRPTVAVPYLRLANYLRNLRSLGYSADELANDGTDRVIDDLVAWGDDDAIATRLGEHLAAGADQVAVQVLGPSEEQAEGYRRVAQIFPVATA